MIGLGLPWKLLLLNLIQRRGMLDGKIRAFCSSSKKKKRERKGLSYWNKRTKLASKFYAFKHSSETTTVRPDSNKEAPFHN